MGGNQLSTEWVSHVIKKQNMIISKAKSCSRYLKKNEKDGIKNPRNMNETKIVDEENGNKYSLARCNS